MTGDAAAIGAVVFESVKIELLNEQVAGFAAGRVAWPRRMRTGRDQNRGYALDKFLNRRITGDFGCTFKDDSGRHLTGGDHQRSLRLAPLSYLHFRHSDVHWA